MQHPTAVVIERRDPVHKPVGFPVGTTFSVPPVRRESAPEPVQYSAFDTIGKVRSELRERTVDTRSFSEWLSVMAWPFRLLKITPQRRTPGGPFQHMNPMPDGVNIDMLPQTSLGSQTAIMPQVTWSPEYAKLGVYT